MTGYAFRTYVVLAKPRGSKRGTWIEVFATRAFDKQQAKVKAESVGVFSGKDYEKVRVVERGA